ncbi:MAG: arginine--tRNA ligase, partial [Chloroflexota bacterium]
MGVSGKPRFQTIAMYSVRQKLAKSVEEAVAKAKESGELPPSVVLTAVTVEHPQNPQHGDYATGLPLKLARSAGQKPLTIAGKIVASLPALPEVGKVTVAPPGFINFTLSDNWLKGQVDVILREGDSYGNLDLGRGSSLQVEFVSVNPTGPVHIGHARSAVLGSTLADVLAAAGYRVTREYYVNDSGSQLEAFS